VATCGGPHTITRAELSAILAALTWLLDYEDRDITIMTDSLTSLYLIQKCLRCPMRLRGHTHNDIVTAIVDSLKSRSTKGLQTCFYKVKAHIGISGNEKADKAAVQVAKGATPDVTPILDVPHAGGKLTYTIAEARRLSERKRPRAGVDSHATSYHVIPDQDKTLKAKMHHHLRLGHSNIDTLYFKLWGAVATRALRSVSNHMWEAQTLPFRAIRHILQYRSGLLRNEKLRKRFARTPQPDCTGNCPLCGKPDSAGHILGGCTHPHPKGQIIKRHTQQVRAIYKQLPQEITEPHSVLLTLEHTKTMLMAWKETALLHHTRMPSKTHMKGATPTRQMLRTT
jgi:ribonuclease HI